MKSFQQDYQTCILHAQKNILGETSSLESSFHIFGFQAKKVRVHCEELLGGLSNLNPTIPEDHFGRKKFLRKFITFFVSDYEQKTSGILAIFWLVALTAFYGSRGDFSGKFPTFSQNLPAELSEQQSTYPEDEFQENFFGSIKFFDVPGRQAEVFELLANSFLSENQLCILRSQREVLGQTYVWNLGVKFTEFKR